jgi:hypothetical protein
MLAGIRQRAPLMCPVALEGLTGSCPSVHNFSLRWLHASMNEERETRARTGKRMPRTETWSRSTAGRAKST